MIIGIISIIISLGALYIAYKAMKGSSQDAAKQIESIRKSSIIMLDAQISAIDLEISRITREYEKAKADIKLESERIIRDEINNHWNPGSRIFERQDKEEQQIREKRNFYQKQIDDLEKRKEVLLKQKEELG